MMMRYLASELPDHVIAASLAKQFGMRPGQVRALEYQVYKLWAEEDARRSPYLKAAARRRIVEARTRAFDAGAWTAVAAMDKVLAQIEGTLEPEWQQLAIDVRLTEAVMVVVGNIEDPERARAIMEREARRQCVPVTGRHEVLPLAPLDTGAEPQG